MKTPSGLKITDRIPGSGPIAEKGKVVLFHYDCYLPKGEKVFTSRDRRYPDQVHLGRRDSFPAFEYGILGMAAGGVRSVTIGPHLAYYERQLRPALPEGATLRYEIELLKVSDEWDNSLYSPPEYSAAEEPSLEGESLEALLHTVALGPPKSWPALQAIAGRNGDDVSNSVRSLLAAPDPYIRRYLVDSLRQAGNVPSFVEEIHALLFDDNAYVVSAACDALGGALHSRSVERIRELLCSQDSGIVLAAIGALQALRATHVFPDLLELYDQKKLRDLTFVLAEALVELTDESNWRELFKRLARDSAPRARTLACLLMERYGAKAELEILQPLVKDSDGHVRKAAARALKRCTGA